MPFKADPASLQSRIRLWLLDNPGEHSPNAIAAGIGVDNKATEQTNAPPVTKVLHLMWKRGLVTKTRPPGAPARGPGTTYSIRTDLPPKE